LLIIFGAYVKGRKTTKTKELKKMKSELEHIEGLRKYTVLGFNSELGKDNPCITYLNEKRALIEKYNKRIAELSK